MKVGFEEDNLTTETKRSSGPKYSKEQRQVLEEMRRKVINNVRLSQREKDFLKEKDMVEHVMKAKVIELKN